MCLSIVVSLHGYYLIHLQEDMLHVTSLHIPVTLELMIWQNETDRTKGTGGIKYKYHSKYHQLTIMHTLYNLLAASKPIKHHLIQLD